MRRLLGSRGTSDMAAKKRMLRRFGLSSVRKNTRGFPIFYQPGRKSEFGGCLPVVQYKYSAVEYYNLYYSRLPREETKIKVASFYH